MKDSKVVKLIGRHSSEKESKENGQKDRSTYALLNPTIKNTKQIYNSENCVIMHI